MTTVYADAVSGNDANNGSTPALAVKSIQVALDLASELRATPPYTWVRDSNVGYRTPITTVQLAAAPSSTPYELTQPTYLDCGSQPVLLRGNPSDPLSVNIFANNSFQGITAQCGSHLICDGFAIRGAPNCTSINALKNGNIAVRNIWFGGVAEGKCCPLGAAGGSQLDVIGKISLMGQGFVAVFSAIENGRIVIGTNNEIFFSNAMDFGIMFNLMYGSAWTQGVPPNFTGAVSGSTGTKINAYFGAFEGISTAYIPGTAVNKDAQTAFPVSTSYVQP